MTPEVRVGESSQMIDIFPRNLGRGQACDLCRASKLRCDGIRPICTRCLEARTKKLKRMRKRGIDEERISKVIFPTCFEASGDTFLDDNTLPNIDSPSSKPSPAKQRRLDDLSKEGGSNNDLYFAEILSSQLPIIVSSASSSSSRSRSIKESPSTSYSPADNTTTDSSFSNRTVQTILYGGAMINIPPPAQLLKLVNVFVERSRMYALFQPQRLLERIAKGPHHDDYPHDAALHIILALAYAERPDLDDTLAEGPAHSRKGAHYKHTLAAQNAVFEALHTHNSAKGIFDVARTLLLLCWKQYAFGDLWESYMSNATAMRGCIGLNLNKETSNATLLERQCILQSELPRITDGSRMQVKPRDEIEAEELRRTMMLAFECDRNCSATTLWPASLADEDYTTSMPRTTLQEFFTGIFTKEVMDRPPRFYNSPDFYSSQAMDADQLIFKGSVILGKCAELISRLPRDATKEYISNMPAFQRLENLITTLRLNNSSFAASLIGMSTSQSSMAAFNTWLTMDQSSSRSYNSLLISSTCIPYACSLTLHEPFANLSQESEAACRAASRSIITIIRLCLASAETELMQLQHILAFVHGLVGRSLIRQLESLYSKLITQEFHQDSTWNSDRFTESASLLQADLEVVLLSLKRIGYKWPIAMKQHETLVKLLQFNPEHRLRGLFCVE